jgi:hypothetical protein
MFLHLFVLSEIRMVTPCFLVHLFSKYLARGFRAETPVTLHVKCPSFLPDLRWFMLINFCVTPKYKISRKFGWVPLFFFYVKTNGMGRHRPFKDYFFLFKAEVLFYKMLLDLRKNVAVWKIPSLHRFACLPRTTWMCNDAEAIRTAWNRSTKGKAYPNTTSSTINIIWTGPGSKPGLNFERPATNSLT